MIFYLGTHRPSWLKRSPVPLFVSRRVLTAKKLPRASVRWALDSGGFSEISLYGKWVLTAAEYVILVLRFIAEIGSMDWAAIQDWMCEEPMLKKTGLSVARHQELTIDSYLDLRSRAPEVPWTPVLQGWEMADYERHVEEYLRRGVDLRALPVVGIGSVCKRQSTAEVEGLIKKLAAGGLRLHGFGFKKLGLPNLRDALASSDSMSWSKEARKQKILLPECEGLGHVNCANCYRWAMRWREDLMAMVYPLTTTAPTCTPEP